MSEEGSTRRGGLATEAVSLRYRRRLPALVALIATGLLFSIGSGSNERSTPEYGFVASVGFGSSIDRGDYTTAWLICQVRREGNLVLNPVSDTIPSPHIGEQVVYLDDGRTTGRGVVFEAHPAGYDPENITLMTVTEGMRGKYCISKSLFDRRTYQRDLPDTAGIGQPVMELIRRELIRKRANVAALGDFLYRSLRPAVWGPDGIVWFAVADAPVLVEPNYDEQTSQLPHTYRVLAAVTLEPDTQCFLLATTYVIGEHTSSWGTSYRDAARRFFAENGLQFLKPAMMEYPGGIDGFDDLDWIDFDSDEYAEAVLHFCYLEGGGQALLRFENGEWRIKARYAAGS